MGRAGERSNKGVPGLAELLRLGASRLGRSFPFLGGEGVLRDAQSSRRVVGVCFLRYCCSASIVDWLGRVLFVTGLVLLR